MATTSGLRANMGFVKQSGENSPAAPTSFPRWLDGSELVPMPKFEKIREGNMSRDFSYILKNVQHHQGKIKCYPRPIEAGALLAWCLGSGLDTVSDTPPNKTHTIDGGAAGIFTSDWFCWDIGFTDYAGAGVLHARVQDCIADQIVITGQAGKSVLFEVDFHGKKVAVFNTSPATASYESGLPFAFMNGTFTVDGSPTVWVREVKVTIKNTVESEELQTGLITPQTLIWTTRQIDIEFTTVFQDNTAWAKAYYNSGTADSALVGTGALDVLFYRAGDPTSTETMELNFPLLNYSAAGPVRPRIDGKALEQKLVATSVVGGGSPVTATVRNSKSSAY